MLKQLPYRQVESIVFWIWPEFATRYERGFAEFAWIIITCCDLALQDVSSPQARPVFSAQLLKAIECASYGDMPYEDVWETAYYWTMGFLTDLRDIYQEELQEVLIAAMQDELVA